jgi:zinc protease
VECVGKYEVGVYPKAPAIESIPLPESRTIEFAKVSETSATSAYTKYNSAKTHIRLSIQSNASTYNAFELMARHMLTKMMTKGVSIKQRVFNEENIHSFLEQNGIERSVNPAPYGIDLVASIPSTDPKVVNRMVSLMKSEIKSPSLSEQDFKYLQRKIGAELSGSMGNVNREASIALAQEMFEDGGCNYSHSSETLKDALWDLTHSSIKEEHAKLMKHGIIKVSVLSPSDEVIAAFKKIGTEKFEPMKYHVLKNSPDEASEKEVHMEGKSSCTVKWGHVIDTPSMATKLAIGVLGNGFSGRLMKEVRDKDGLTYGIYAKQNRLYGAHTFEVTATFAPSLLQRGLSETARVMKEWKEGPVSMSTAV